MSLALNCPDRREDKTLHSYRLGPGRAVAFSPDGLLVAVGGKEGKLVLLDAE